MNGSTLNVGHRGEPWFDDGNIILLTDDSDSAVAYKVHRGVLARHSEVFQSMFDIPPPTAGQLDVVDNCPVVRMYDLPIELSNLIVALYDGASFHTRSLEDFFYLAGILRLATKYLIAHLRTAAIVHLTQTWAHTLRGHDDMVERAIHSPLVNDTTYPYVHPIHVLHLARETHVRLVVPAAFYFLSLYPLSDILRADHPKLSFTHPSSPSSHLAPEDIQLYTLMFQHRISIVLDFVRHDCGGRTASPHCANSKACAKGFSRLASRLERSWVPRTGPLHYMVQATDELAEDDTVCAQCRRAFRHDVSVAREKIWQELPSVVGLPGWDELLASDLPDLVPTNAT